MVDMIDHQVLPRPNVPTRATIANAYETGMVLMFGWGDVSMVGFNHEYRETPPDAIIGASRAMAQAHADMDRPEGSPRPATYGIKEAGRAMIGRAHQVVHLVGWSLVPESDKQTILSAIRSSHGYIAHCDF